MFKRFSISILLSFVLLAALLVGCSPAGSRPVDIPYAKDGGYLGFSDIPDGYTAADAIADGCLVIDTTNKLNQYMATVTDTQETAGYEHWAAFTDTASRGEDAFIRVAHFIDGVGYYSDLYYLDGKYTIFDLNEYGVSEGESFKYLRRLDGMAGPPNDRKEACFYVLTDSLELTYDDVSWSHLASDLSTVTDIPYVWLGFMIYFE